MPKIDIASIPWRSGSGYPQVFRSAFAGRHRRPLGDAVGLTQFGVNLTRIDPGCGSSLRHWHENEDELVYILDGEAVLIEDDGEKVMRAGDAAGFKAGVANGHCLVNRTDRPVMLLEIGTRAKRERGFYSDVDMMFETDETGDRFLHKSGEPYR